MAGVCRHLDDLLIAIDANTGRELWEVRTANTMEGIQMSGAPLAVDGKIITGMSGGELGARGYLDAYDPVTGKRLWRTFTIPAKGEPGNESWAGDSWKIGGAPTWLTGSYDPELHTLYSGPAIRARYNAGDSKGDNLYSDSVLAIIPTPARSNGASSANDDRLGSNEIMSHRHDHRRQQRSHAACRPQRRLLCDRPHHRRCRWPSCSSGPTGSPV